MKKKLYNIRIIIAGLVFILCILAICGVIYPLKIFDLQFAASLQRVIFDYSLIALLILVGVIALTLLFGRLYCSLICPFGIMQEFASFLFKSKCKKQNNYKFKYFIASLTIGCLIGGSAIFIRYIDPYTLFGSAISLSKLGIVLSLLILTLVFFQNRFFCTNICPIGAILGLISKIAPFKIYINKEKCVSCGLCAKTCPSGCINFKEKNVDNEMCVKCLKCISKCQLQAMNYGTEKKKEKLTFNIKRRKFLYTAFALLTVTITAVKAGVEFSDKYAKKIKNIILPPGALNASRMANKCLNCNLCINNCPNKILAKSSQKFPAVHIDYSLGKGYCKYDCNECEKVCPSGAIKRMKLDEKQRTRIAMAVIDQTKCNKCGICVYDCPLGAISKKDGETALIDGAKCIGCGKCKNSCQFDAIQIYAVNEQIMI